jgi:hypothetical protein
MTPVLANSFIPKGAMNSINAVILSSAPVNSMTIVSLEMSIIFALKISPIFLFLLLSSTISNGSSSPFILILNYC